MPTKSVPLFESGNKGIVGNNQCLICNCEIGKKRPLGGFVLMAVETFVVSKGMEQGQH